LDAGRIGVAVTYLALLAVIFIGMATIMLRMAQGVSPRIAPRRESWTAVVPPAALAAVVLLLGIYLPGHLTHLLRETAHLLANQ
jgi:formate hydrogenlyase subunit 3/multisubunit Na+/H+ antiporter MnhD subunit